MRGSEKPISANSRERIRRLLGSKKVRSGEGGCMVCGFRQIDEREDSRQAMIARRIIICRKKILAGSGM
jgi:hypothetical protein